MAWTKSRHPLFIQNSFVNLNWCNHRNCCCIVLAIQIAKKLIRRMKPYLTLMFFLLLVCVIVGWVLSTNHLINLPTPFWLAPALFFPFVSSLIHYFLLRTVKGKPSSFVTAHMGMLSLKMFLHLIVIVAVAFSFSEYAFQFILVYAGFYLLYTVAETVSLFKVFYKK
jgi:hypothetical protein